MAWPSWVNPTKASKDDSIYIIHYTDNYIFFKT